MTQPTRSQKRWSGRLRMAGALLILIGVVALVDRILPGAERALATFPIGVQLGLGAAAVAIGTVLFWLGRRWR